MRNQITETWLINNRVNLMLLDAISEEGFACTLSKRGGRNVALQFVHIHNVRLWRLEGHGRAFYKGNVKISKEEPLNAHILSDRLSESAVSIAEWMSHSVDQNGKIGGFKRGVIPMLGYMIAHEAHHRGNIILTLKQSGHSLPKDVRNKIWAWNQI